MSDIDRVEYLELELPSGVIFEKSTDIHDKWVWNVYQNARALEDGICLTKPTFREAVDEAQKKFGLEIIYERAKNGLDSEMKYWNVSFSVCCEDGDSFSTYIIEAETAGKALDFAINLLDYRGLIGWRCTHLSEVQATVRIARSR